MFVEKDVVVEVLVWLIYIFDNSIDQYSGDVDFLFDVIDNMFKFFGGKWCRWFKGKQFNLKFFCVLCM